MVRQQNGTYALDRTQTEVLRCFRSLALSRPTEDVATSVDEAMGGCVLQSTE